MYCVGYEDPTADKDVIAELLSEAKEINVNLTEFTENLSVLTKTYCLCRQLYFGVMVGCDTCNEWYHFSCINMTVAQAERCEMYICVRCALYNSFNYSAELVGKFVFMCLWGVTVWSLLFCDVFVCCVHDKVDWKYLQSHEMSHS